MSWCDGCGRAFETCGALDTHRRHPRSGQDCRYRPGHVSPAVSRIARATMPASHWRTGPARA